MQIITDNWEGVYSNERALQLVDVKQISDAINELNGRNKTLIGILISEDTYLSVGGGNEGRYVVTGNSGETIFNLIEKQPDTSSEEIEIVAGGQAGLYEKKYCVDRKTAIEVAIAFFASHSFESRFDWEVLE